MSNNEKVKTKKKSLVPCSLVRYAMAQKAKALFSPKETEALIVPYDEGMDSVGKNKTELIDEMADQLGRERQEIKVQII